MATTTNYGWTTPDDTSLVKDGASAIRTLGSSVDTTVKNLNPETTLGDISYRSSTANTNTRLALGTAGQVLTVNSGATAPEWATPSSGGMTLISTTNLTGAASISLGTIPQTYNHLQLIIRGFKPTTDGDGMLHRLNSDSTTKYVLGYYNSTVLQNGTTTAPNDSKFKMPDANQDNTVATGLIVINLYDYANTSTWKFADFFTMGVNTTTNTSMNSWRAMGYYFSTSAITAWTLLTDAGTNFNGGTALLYGVK